MKTKQEDVAKRLADCTFADKVFFCSSGLEAIEATIKFVRKYFSQIGKDCKNRIITLKNGFHGRSMAGVSACGSNFAKKGFAPLLQGFDNILINFCISSSILLLFMINRIILESE